MALTRKFLSALGIEAEKIDEIISAHAETVEGLKEERDSFKADAEALKEAKKKVSDLEKEVEGLKESTKDSYKVKYEALKEEFGDYKKSIETEKTRVSKEKAFREILKEIGVSEKRIESVLKVSDIDGLKLDGEGKIEGVDDLKKSLVSEWEDFIVKTESKGADTANPPKNNGGGAKSKDEIMKIKDTKQRQDALLEYLNNGGK